MSSPHLKSSNENNPFSLFQEWFKQAENSGEEAPEAMSVATSTLQGRPSVRTLLLKKFDKNGFVFYTNSESRKGEELHENPFAALLFFWKSLNRQVRIEGPVSLTSPEEADAYFKTRPFLSKAGAHISKQSHPLASWKVLEEELEEKKKLYEKTGEIPRPQYWNGYRLTPTLFEFWEARPFRLHHRIQWKKTSHSEGETWQKELLYP